MRSYPFFYIITVVIRIVKRSFRTPFLLQKVGEVMQLSGKLILSSDIHQTYNKKISKAQQFVDSECIRLMVPYTPMLSGQMIQSATRGTVIGSGEIKYNSPYARYQYYGKLMISSITGSTFARKGESKVLTNKDLNYNKSRHPRAGKLWFERMKADHKEQILRGVQKFL